MRVPIFMLIVSLFTVSHTIGQDLKEVVTKSGLRYVVLKAGSGEVARTGQEVGIYETMSYLSGKQFYSIDRPAPPIKVVLGTKQVIAGVDEALTGMRLGEVRKVIVPPSLSKRIEYPANLSPDSTLLYRIELVEIYSNEKK